MTQTTLASRFDGDAQIELEATVLELAANRHVDLDSDSGDDS